MSGVPNEEDKKPTDQAAHINLKVKGQVRTLAYFHPFYLPSQFRIQGFQVLKMESFPAMYSDVCSLVAQFTKIQFLTV